MGEKLDQLARAIEAKSSYVISEHHAKAIARTIVETMREPTEAMVRAAWYDVARGPLVEESSVCKGYHDIRNDTAYEVWQAMIDEILK